MYNTRIQRRYSIEFRQVTENPYLFDIILKIYYLSVVLLVPIGFPGDT